MGLDLELVHRTGTQVGDHESALHLDAVGHEGPVELVDGPVLDDEVEDGAAVVGPGMESQHHRCGIGGEEGGGPGDARRLALGPHGQHRGRGAAAHRVLRGQVEVVGVATKQVLEEMNDLSKIEVICWRKWS